MLVELTALRASKAIRKIPRLAGSVALLFSDSIGSGAATLTALGQISAIWVGGGTIVPWALIPAAAICNVDPFELFHAQSCSLYYRIDCDHDHSDIPYIIKKELNLRGT
jgi:hypothetical protein